MRERCTEPLGRPFECWFGVGQPDGHHSMVWKIWAARKTADLYIAARSMGGTMKASLHASGKRNVGLTSEYVRSLESRQSWHGGSRHYDSWESGTELSPGLTLEFLLRFPTAQLRPFPLTQRDVAKKVVWLAPAPEGQVLEVALLYTPSESPVGTDLPTGGGPQVVLAGRLADARQVLLIGMPRPDITFEGQGSKLREVADQFLQMGMSPPSKLDDRIRLILGFSLEGGVRGWTEVAAGILDKPGTLR
jgi:hypothetical protein